MAFGIGRGNKRLLDRQQVFEFYGKYGSVHNVALELYKIGIYNKELGKPFTDMAIQEASWRYALENLVEARKLANENKKLTGDILSDAEWYKLVVGKAQKYYTRKQFDAFMLKHSYMKPYA
jgi:hypothetical protein